MRDVRGSSVREDRQLYASLKFTEVGKSALATYRLRR
jgi:hypothetical protein